MAPQFSPVQTSGIILLGIDEKSQMMFVGRRRSLHNIGLFLVQGGKVGDAVGNTGSRRTVSG